MSKSILSSNMHNIGMSLDYIAKSKLASDGYFHPLDLLQVARVYYKLGNSVEAVRAGNELRNYGYNENALKNEPFYNEFENFSLPPTKPRFDTTLILKLDKLFERDQHRGPNSDSRTLDSLNFIELQLIFNSGITPNYKNVGFMGMRKVIIMLVHICRYKDFANYFSFNFIQSYVNDEFGLPRSQASWILKNHYFVKEFDFDSIELPAMGSLSTKNYSGNIDSLRYKIGLLSIKDNFSYKSKNMPREYEYTENCECRDL